LLQAISEAGGLLNERARKKEIVVFRPHGNGTYETKMIDIKQMLNAKGSQEDYPILPGDIIYVPQNRASKVQRFLPTANMGAYVSPTTF
jgi:protein involved in polysaccharide export with SLBB domain